MDSVLFRFDLFVSLMFYCALGIHAAKLVAPGALSDGWLFNLSRYRGNARILAEAWEFVFAAVTIVFAFYFWWIVLSIYYLGPDGPGKKVKA